jgi:transposase
VDRYAAYKAMAKNRKIVLVYCWSHVRRDFLDVANKWPQHEQWAMQWVELIGEIYHLNNARLEVLAHPEEFALRDEKLRRAVDAMSDRLESELKDEKRHHACKKALESLDNHLDGLTVFVEHPEIPMDNNKAERLLRGPVLGRKNYYGSGSEWSGRLAAVLFSIFQTLDLFGLNPRSWMQMYLQVCAENGGKAPENIDKFLPWNLSERQRSELCLKPALKDSS